MGVGEGDRPGAVTTVGVGVGVGVGGCSIVITVGVGVGIGVAVADRVNSMISKGRFASTLFSLLSNLFVVWFRSSFP